MTATLPEVRPEAVVLQLAAAPATLATASASQRTINGLAVPYGEVGTASLGGVPVSVTFSQGSLAWSDVGRVKFLKQHDPERVNGFATSLADRPNGLFAGIHVPPSPEGDLALQEAADGRRDGLSAGVKLSEATISEIFDKLMAGDNSPTAATGELLEISQVSIPAFRSARTEGSAAASAPALAAAFADGLLTLSVDFGGAPEAPASPTKENTMPDVATPAPATAAAELATPKPDSATNQTLPAPAAAPSPFGGAVTAVSSEEAIYRFDGTGPSFVKDVLAQRFEGSADAAQRLAKFNAMLKDRNPAQHGVMTAAVETRATAPNIVNNGWRPDLLVNVIDRGRPIISRLSVNGLPNAMPYKLPVEADFYRSTVVADGATTSGSTTVTSATAAFVAGDVGRTINATNLPAGTTIAKVTNSTTVTVSKAATATGTSQTLTILRVGVSDHTEGTAHVTEGDLDVNSVTVTPGAVSGAYRVSRELADASTPAIDGIALNAMVRDYRYATEAKVVAALAAAAPSPTASVNTLVELRRELNLAYDDSGEEPDFIAAAPSYYATLIQEVDSTGRPMLASVNPMNSAGQTKPAGFTGATVDGVEMVKALRVGGDVAYIVHAADVHVAESGVQTFRFEEVEGPGIIKLALWGYFAAQVTRALGVRSVTSV